MARRKNFHPKVIRAYPTFDYKLYLYFNDDSMRLYDVKPLIQEEAEFAPLKDIEIFKNELTIIKGAPVWIFKDKDGVYKSVDLKPNKIYWSQIITPPPPTED